ncbi:uncharacterized protein LOC124513569 isoform X2 [Lynx rufus]|uniref:uncharacterized protein LOC124513569 isoform X2 n=1 Tax=Lynx rufus TaxID=61384 RepID=UPI001F122DEB|nr:uncharacterized protein LOC124513569 isoform X2 [Lynx rufus]
MKELQTFTDEKVDSNDLKIFLGSLGIELTDQEKEKLLKTLPIDAAGKVYHNRLLKGVKCLNGGKVHVNNLDNTLKKLGLELTEEELAKLSKNLQVDANGMVGLKEVMDGVKATTGGEVDVKDMKALLKNMGIEFTDKGRLKLLKNLPFNDDNKVFKNRLLDGVKSLKVDEKIPLETLMENITDFTGEKIESSELKNVLGNLGIELTDEELEKLLKILPIDANGKLYRNRLLKAMKSLKTNGNVDLHDVMEGMKAITGKVDIKNLETVLGDMGTKLTDQELEDLKENLPVSVDNTVALKTLKDEVKAFTGEKVDSRDLQNTLKDMGIELTDKEAKQLRKTLPLDAHGKVFQSRLLKDVKYNKRGKIDVNNLDPVLEAMEVKLTEKELNLLKDLLRGSKKVDLQKLMEKVEAVTVKGKVDLEKLMNEVKSFSGDKVDANRLESVFENLGIKLTPNEHLNLLKTLPLDADGEVYKKRLMKGIKSLKRGSVDVNKLDTLLENMGISITEGEFMDLIERLPDDDKGKVKLDTLIEELSSVLGKQVDVSDVDSALKDMKVEVTDKEYFNLVKTLPVDAEGKVYQKGLLDGVKALQRGKVAMNNLVPFLENMGIKLSHEELEDFSQNLPVDGGGKVDLKNVTMKMKEFTGEKIDATDLKNILGDMGIEVNDKECLELQKLLPADADGNVSLKKVMSDVKAVTGEKVNVKDLKNILEDIGIEFTPKEYLELVKNLQVDGQLLFLEAVWPGGGRTSLGFKL